MRVSRLLGSAPITRLSEALTTRRLRVLAYHGIRNPDAFAAQLDEIAERYVCVTSQEVIRHVRGEQPLAERSVWITFDDGEPTVANAGRQMLADRGLNATLFVCPGLVNTTTPFWWDVVRLASDRHLIHRSDELGGSTRSAVGILKRTDDRRRRAVISQLSDRLSTMDAGHFDPQLTTDDLRAWVGDGNEIGNHSWDHPCLDRCSESEQSRQIRDAHELLVEWLGHHPNVFAWPNGNPSDASSETLEELSYELELGFDHRLCRRSIDPTAVSRLRVDSDADIARFRSIMSGAHSGLFHLRDLASSLRPRST